ncbi:hypothetical protein [Polymorphospora rubra]|uniref:hypothetical protein n=1 Tax=Polymorphospora rubra TaxID=338584 RepID=UPI001BB33A0F|nr:hypothetical protein [Polymorphospora rubra]
MAGLGSGWFLVGFSVDGLAAFGSGAGSPFGSGFALGFFVRLTGSPAGFFALPLPPSFQPFLKSSHRPGFFPGLVDDGEPFFAEFFVVGFLPLGEPAGLNSELSPNLPGEPFLPPGEPASLRPGELVEPAAFGEPDGLRPMSRSSSPGLRELPLGEPPAGLFLPPLPVGPFLPKSRLSGFEPPPPFVLFGDFPNSRANGARAAFAADRARPPRR